MTVIRKDTRTFEAPRARVVDAVRRILSKGQPKYIYIDTEETLEGDAFTTRIRPTWRLLLSTMMTITLEGNGPRTNVSVETRSQFLVLGDVLDMYRQYIRDLLFALDEQLERDA